MSAINEKSVINFSLFLFLVISQMNINYVPFLIALTIILLSLSNGMVYKFRAAKLLCIILILGIFSSIVNFFILGDIEIYHFIRDVFYFFQPLVFIYIGYWYKSQKGYHLKGGLRLIVGAIVAVSSYKMLQIFFNFNSISSFGLELRYQLDLNNPSSTIGLFIIFTCRYIFDVLFSKKIDLLFVFLLIISIVLSFSRTEYISIIILLFVPYLVQYRLNMITLYSAIALLLIIIFGGSVLGSPEFVDGNKTFYDKMLYSVNEVTVTKMDDKYQITQNWRGYEAYMGLSKYLEGNVFQLLFGQGFSSLVKTPNWVFQDNDYLDYIPVFHNGYITILLKTGMIGLFVFFMLVINLSKTKARITQFGFYLSVSKVGLSLYILITTFVVHGLYYTEAPVILLFFCGFLLSMDKDILTLKHEDI
ncbi:TPA: O-antigen ligase family protein [Enterobacter hormaechei]